MRQLLAAVGPLSLMLCDGPSGSNRHLMPSDRHVSSLYPDEQKTSVTVEPIPRKIVPFVESGSNSMHFGGGVYNMYTSSIGKKFAAGYQHSV